MTIVVTKSTGGTAQPMESTYVPPESQVAATASPALGSIPLKRRASERVQEGND